MSGHSKWSNIKHKKEKSDAVRGKIFTKIGREIAIAVREGGADPNNNSRLRDVIAKAKANNMPNDNIQRSIKKASGEGSGVSYEEITYEGYGKGGVAVFVETLTDNRNRTASDVRHLFDKFGNSLGATGCVAWMFDRKGVLILERTQERSEDDVMMAAIEAGAEDFTAYEENYEILTAPADLGAVREALEGQGYTFVSSELEYLPQNTVAMDPETQEALDKLIENLEDLDDVQNVYHNGEEA
ncbi:YebC/PmpR family DNA-binding transcriptional regulator [Christensenella sp. MSJ-20]|uniref:YebC/PmpR family DNA-binding transcriptional regulator n=1 Tax=Christensenella sp. MSJ-20 TaxID=2841518 RepID=UPI001C76DD2A|nr:YebC/PmpR family DNA-binding transcriptional regulator [Christensenella sp. MSJ-20]